MTDILLPQGKCAYWKCENPTQGTHCREHRPVRCRVCGCKPYGSRGLTYGMCLKHYKYWARHHSPQRARILANDREYAARQRAARRLLKAAEGWDDVPWEPESEAERQQMGGWTSGGCLPQAPGLYVVQPGS
jgi:hypothetical protein